jgi:tetratricopeptide (TPR) repeat protein
MSISITSKLPVTKRDAAILYVLVMIVLILVVYWPVQNYDFVNYDDHGYVTSNNIVQAGFVFNSVQEAFSKNYLGNWHPLTMLSHMLDWQLFGLSAGGHHWTNVIIHILNMILLFLLFNKLTGAMWRSAFIAALFAIHPVNVESVTWISERKNVLSTFFWIITIMFYVWYARFPNWKRYLAVAIGFALGLMSKPMLVTLPFTLLLLDYWPLDRMKIKKQLEDQTNETTGDTLRKERILFLVLEKVPLFILSAFFSYIVLLAQKNAGACLSLQSFPLSYRLGNAVISYVLYITKMFWPFDLAALYPLNYNMFLWQIVLSAVLLIVVTISVSVCAYLRKLPYLLMGWLWYLGTLVPVIGIIQVGDQAMADRYAYVPFIGLFIMLTWGAFDILKRYFSSKTTLIIALSIIVGLTIVAKRQVQYWQNTLTLFDHALDVTRNNSVAHSIVAGELLMQNKVSEAMIHCKKALLLIPNNYNALVREAKAYDLLGENNEAIDALRLAIRVHPEHAKAHNDLCILFLKAGKVQDAMKEYKKAVELNLNKDNLELHNNFGNILATQGHYDEAIIQYNQALLIQPHDAVVHFNLALILLRQGKTDDALNHLREVIRLQPDNAKAHYQLALILKQKGLTEEANRHYQGAIRINPGYKDYKEGKYEDKKINISQ